MTLAERLKFARESLGLRLQDVKERTGICESTLSDYERAVREPRLSRLKKLAELYCRPVSFFLEEGPLPRSPQISWRQRPLSPQAEKIEADFLQLVEQYRRLELLCQERKAPPLPQYEFRSDQWNYPLIGELARSFWEENRLGPCPGCELLRVLEEIYQVKIFYLPFEPTGTAACTWGETFGPAILLNMRTVRWQRNFDLAHELFHLLTWKSFRSSFCPETYQLSEQQERWATCFATHLLLPPELLQSALESEPIGNGFTVSALYRIAEQFDVSIDAVIWQIRFMEERSDSWARQCIGQCKALGDFWEHRLSDTPPRLPRRYVALAQKALQQGLISVGTFAQYMNLRRPEALAWAEKLTEAQVALETPG